MLPWVPVRYSWGGGGGLAAHLWLDLPRVPGEEGEEALCARYDYVNLVEGDGVDDLLPLLELPLRALHKPGARPCNYDVVIANIFIKTANMLVLTAFL